MCKFQLTAHVYDSKDRFIAKAQNNYLKSHPFQADCAAKVGMPDKIFLHAEIAAIIKAQKISKDLSKIRIIRLGKDGSKLLSKPCPVCMEAIKLAGIQVILYFDKNTEQEIYVGQ